MSNPNGLNVNLPANITAAPAAVSDVPTIGGDPAANTIAGSKVAPTNQPAGDTPKVELTPRQKLEKQIEAAKARIEKDTAFVATATQQLDTADQLAAIDTGWQVRIKIGRDKTAKEVDGVVTGVAREGDKVRYKVYYGEGFDADTVVIQPSQIISTVAPQ